MMKGLTAPEQAAAEQAPAQPAAPLILVVDDAPDIRELLRLHLTSSGYRVALAEDAVAAGHCINNEMPELVIADYKMPYMNGVDFIAALRADSTLPDVPVIFMTDIDGSHELSGNTFGFPIVTKPVFADRLLETVAAELAGSGWHRRRAAPRSK
jgi:DNA-binding response OmpR family regulator